MMPSKSPSARSHLLLVAAHAIIPVWLFVNAGAALSQDRWLLHLMIAPLFLCTLWWKCTQPTASRPTNFSWLQMLLPALPLMAGGMALQWSSHPEAGLSTLLGLFDLWLFGWSLHWLLAAEALRRFWLYYLPLLGAISGFQAIFSFTIGTRTHFGASGMLVNANHLAAWLTALLGFTLTSHFTHQRDTSHKRRSLWLIGILFGGLLLTQSRAGIAIGALLLLSALRRSEPWLSRRRRLSVGLGLVGLIGGVLAWQWHLGKPLAASLTARLDLWRTACRAWLQQPWFGSGFGTFADLYTRFTGVDTSRFISSHAHNDYLQWLVETGLLGCAALACCVWLFWRRLRLQQPLSGMSAGALMGVTALLLHAAVDFPLQLPSHLFLLLTMLLLALHGGTKTAPMTGNKPTSGKRTHLLTLTAFTALAPSLIYALWMLWPSADKPLNHAALLAYTQMQLHSGRASDALQSARRLRSLRANADSSALLASVHEQLEQTPEALFWFTRALEEDPGNLMRHEDLGNFHLRRGNPLAAWRAYQQVVNKQPERFGHFFAAISLQIQDPLLLKNLVPATTAAGHEWLNFIEQRLPPLLLSESQAWLKRFPDCAAGFAETEMRALHHSRDWATLAQKAGEFAQRCPESLATAHHFQAVAAWRDGGGDSQQALSWWRQALSAQPEHVMAWQGVDSLLLRQARLRSDWLRELEELLKQHPANRQLRHRLCMLQDQLGMWQEALACAKKLVSGNLADTNYKMLLARLYSDRKMYSQGMRLYRDVLAAEPRNADAYFQLSQIYLGLRLYKEASQLLQTALRQLPDDTRLRDLLAGIPTAQERP